MEICDINPYIFYAKMHDYMQTHDSRTTNEYMNSYNGRLFYIEEGECKIIIEDVEYEAKKDTLMLWQAGTKYCFLSYENVRMIVLNFDYTQKNHGKTERVSPVASRKFHPEKILSREVFSGYEPFNHPLVLDNMQAVRKNLFRIVDQFNGTRLYKNESSSALLKSVLTEVAALSSYSGSKVFAKIDAVLEYIKENYEKNITNEELGKLSGYHPYYLNRLILKHTGMTLRQQLIHARIETAKEMLTQTDMPIYQIAERCGFNNTGYFSGYFKEKTGTSPATYRKKYKDLI